MYFSRLLRATSLRLRSLFQRRRFERDLDDEIRDHLDSAAQEYIERGCSPAEARRQAMLDFNGVEQAKEACRETTRVAWVHNGIQDLRFGWRTLVRNPIFTCVAALTLALGIGSTTAIFSVVKPVLLDPLPYPDANRVVTIWDHRGDGQRLEVTFGTYRELAQRGASLEFAAAMKPWQPTMTGPDEPERLNGQKVGADFFRSLGVPPAAGRDFEVSDDRMDGPLVAILSHELWQRRFLGREEIVGTPIKLDDREYTVIGVMPIGFEDPLFPSAQIWTPLQYDMSQGRAWGHHLRMVARLRPGFGLDQARIDLDGIAHRPTTDFPRVDWAKLENGVVIDSLRDTVAGDSKPVLFAVLGAVLILLAIASVNVANLLLARGVYRRGEFALRAALGAPKGRLIQQLLTESLMLAALGGIPGLAVAEFGLRALVALGPTGLPRLGAIHFDSAAFAFGVAVTALMGALVGVIPALRASREIRVGFQRGSGRGPGSRGLARRTLVVAEVALALALLVGAGLLLRSLETLFSIPTGFDAQHLLTMQVQTAGSRFDDKGVTDRYFQEVLEAARRVPGVTAAALTSQLPLSGDLDQYGVHFEEQGADEAYNSFRYAVSPGYLTTMGIPLLRGRPLNAADATGSTLAVLISESLAKSQFAGRDPLGSRLRVGPNDAPWAIVVGIVGDIRQGSLATGSTEAVYFTNAQWAFPDKALWLVVKTDLGATSITPALRRAIWSIDKDQPIVRVAWMQDLVEASEARRRFALIVFEAFALAALVLAAAGIHGLLANEVAERTREFGVRTTLGASRARILGLVIRQGLTLTALGVAMGSALAALSSKAIGALLFGVSPLDPMTYLSMAALLLLVSITACWMPAWRAASIDPIVALRYE